MVYLKIRLARAHGIAYIDFNTSCLYMLQTRHIKTDLNGLVLYFKLYVIINDQADLSGCHLISGNVDNRLLIRQMSREFMGQSFGDRVYISQALHD